jgi:hypothetical protein
VVFRIRASYNSRLQAALAAPDPAPKGWRRRVSRHIGARNRRCIPASAWPDSGAVDEFALGLSTKIVVYCDVRNKWDLGHSERTMNAKKIAVVSLLVAVVALAACRREECCRPMKLGAGDVAAAELAR